MEKYIIAVSAVDDAICVPLSKLRQLSIAADATIIAYCEPGIHDPTGADADADLITLTVTADTEKAVFTSLVQQFNGGPHNDGVLVLCDDVAGVFAHANILSCTITRNAI